jgi:hypothetical protein
MNQTDVSMGNYTEQATRAGHSRKASRNQPDVSMGNYTEQATRQQDAPKGPIDQESNEALSIQRAAELLLMAAQVDTDSDVAPTREPLGTPRGKERTTLAKSPVTDPRLRGRKQLEIDLSKFIQS